MILKRIILIPLAILVLFSQNAYSQISENTAVSINITADQMYYFVEGEEISLVCAKKVDGVWATGTPEESFNKHLINWVSAKTPFISYDGFSLYFSAKESTEGNFDLYCSRRQNGEWREPVKLNTSDTKVNEMAPSVSSDNTNLYFAKQNESGCYSIFYSKINISGSSWAAPMPLSVPITVGCENYPLISADGNILFFSSDRQSTRRIKRQQIYYSYMLTNGIWSIPQPISSGIDYDEFAPAIDPYKGEMHITRVANFKADLYTFNLNAELIPDNFSVYKGVIQNEGEPTYAVIELVNAFNDNIAGVFESDHITGNYLVVAPSNGHYYLNFKVNNAAKKSIYISPEKGIVTQKNINLFKQAKARIKIYDFNTMQAIDAKIGLENIELVREALGVYKFAMPLEKTITAYVTKAGYEESKIEISSENLQFPELEYGITLKPSLQTYELKVNDATTNNPISANIYLRSKNIEFQESIKTISEGNYYAYLPKEEEYDLYVFSKGYMYFKTNITTKGDRLRESLRISLIPLNKVGKITLDKISFVPNTAQLTGESKEELQALIKMLNINPTLKTQFTVYHSKGKLGKELADKRAAALFSYFGANNINLNRIGVELAILKDDTKGVIEATLSF